MEQPSSSFSTTQEIVPSSMEQPSSSFSPTQEDLKRMEHDKAMFIRQVANKLTVFSTRTMKPLLTHADLAPVMARAGFFHTVNHPSPPSTWPNDVRDRTFLGCWREYVHASKWAREPSLDQPTPRAMLPYPRIDGLHIGIYADFINAVEYYLKKANAADIIHVRAMKMDNRVRDWERRWARMRDEVGSPGEVMYREVTWPYPYYEQDKEGASKNWVMGSSDGVSMSHRVPVYVAGPEDDVEAGRFVEFSDVLVTRGVGG